MYLLEIRLILSFIYLYLLAFRDVIDLVILDTFTFRSMLPRYNTVPQLRSGAFTES